MRKILCLVVLGALVIGGGSGGASQKDRVFKKLMQDKLKSSQAILEGLALADFGKMEHNADRLLSISNADEWFAYKTPEYKLFSNEFRRAADKLARSAKARNIDGAALSYVELTMTCVRCHQYVREVRMAQGGPPGPRLTAVASAGH
jgi:hypothetical protein